MAGIYTVQRDGMKVSINNLREDAWKVIAGGLETGDFGDLKTLFERVPWLNRGIDVCAGALTQMPWVILNAADEEVDGSEDYRNSTGLWADPLGDLYKAEAALLLWNAAYYLKQKAKRGSKSLGVRYLVPSTITPKVDKAKGLVGFERNLAGRPPVRLRRNPPSWFLGLPQKRRSAP